MLRNARYLYSCFFCILAAALIADSAMSAEKAVSNSLEDGVKSHHAIEETQIRIDIGGGVQIPFVWIELIGIWAGQFEITNGQYRRFDGNHISKPFHGFQLNANNQPAVWVSWEDACNYCDWFNRNFDKQIPSGYSCRLPEESEWQLIAACGEPRTFPWGNLWPPPNQWNYRGQEGRSGIFKVFHAKERFIRSRRDSFIVSAPVSRSGKNLWGLFGIGGNVWEWCDGFFDQERTERVLRGASWSNYKPQVLAVTNRANARQEKKNAIIGFRIVLAPVRR